jgi:ABC-type transport system substrate-binding protein
MSNVEEIRVIGPHTIQLALNGPDALFLAKIINGPTAGWVMGAPKYMKEIGWEEFLKRPVGTGPFVVEEEVKDQTQVPEGEAYATLVANPDYWNKGYPKIHKVVFIRYPPKKAVQAVIEGRVDVVTSLIPKDAWKVEKNSNSQVVKGEDDLTYTAGFLNLRSKHASPLHDIRVRKALNYAINKKELMRYAYKGNAVEMRGILSEKAGVDLSEAEPYSWNVPKARELLKEAGYGEGFKMKLFYQEKNYLTAKFLQRFYSLLKIELEITPVDLEWIVKHIVYPNTKEGYSWKDEDWGVIILSNPGHVPELMGGMLEWAFHFCAPWQTSPDSLMAPLDMMYHQVRETNDSKKRYKTYKKANDYIAEQAFYLFTMAPLSLYGVNAQVNFVPQVSQYLYLDYSSVSDNHWSVR